ncbi:MAG: Signal recognition particle protein [Chlamydiales bacterium]|nr:Signal recognition particle protein [Chlamydiales bacterium]MCH9619104.1 Signal recognition particle protein [Chlamydiales bacterium]MCH9622366.1 Signal recognition particle protein [Chlamydiales bacterium]
MFGSIAEKFTDIFSSLAGKKRLTEENISESVRQVRMALLEADVNYTVVKTFIKSVKEKALGEKTTKSVLPGQQFVKLIHDELAVLMGGDEATLNLSSKPSVWMLCGLQGSGKTTHAAKIARFLQKKEHRKRALLVACDLQRPAAVLQLKRLGEQIDVPVFSIEGEKDPVKVAKKALKEAKQYDVVIFDTAGRLHIDDVLMKELERVKKAIDPEEILFVANGATGQDAVKTAAEFDARLGITGSILTMLDGDSRGGAAISITQVTGKPLKFEGIGEKLDDLQLFNADSMADRILGMGDTINLVKKAEEHISEEEQKDLEEKMRKASFTYNDYLKQIQSVRKMGSFGSIMKMLPGAAKMPDFSSKEKEFFKIEAMILSMTPRERAEKDQLDVRRSKRVARGSGTELSDVNKLKKSFKQSKQFFKNAPNKKQLEKMMGGR